MKDEEQRSGVDAAAGAAAPSLERRHRIVTLEDRGQDFTWFEIDETGLIVDAGPFQAWMWKRYRIEPDTLCEGVQPLLTRTASRLLHYRIVAITQKQEPAAGAAATDAAPNPNSEAGGTQ